MNSIKEWREHLAKNVAIRNEALSVDEINEAVQRIIDRFVFIRNLEDREIEAENTLWNIVSAKNDVTLVDRLKPFFRVLDEQYNGLLFKTHFSESLAIDDKVIKDIVSHLSHRSPYKFDIIEPEILGRIYEQFLGSKVRLTESHRAKVEEKPEVRHAGGVYYTPQYIVDYIVSNTLGKQLNKKTPEEVLKLRILDPACGSGSFLLGAFHFLIEWHRHYYDEHKNEKKYRTDWYLTSERELRLTLKKKSEILKHCLYGVDLDHQAVEVSIMSLYLKMLDEGFDYGQDEMFKKAILPDLTTNIRQGNSLIDREQLYSNNLFGDEDITPFDWHDFGQSGFDVIIGNPPYIRIQEMNAWAPKEVELYKKIYSSCSAKNYDIYVVFIEKALSLLSTKGDFGFILPNKFMQQEYGEAIREHISKGKNVVKIVNFKDFQVFKGATTYTCLLFLTKQPSETFEYAECSSDDMDLDFTAVQAKHLTSAPWQIHNSGDMDFLGRFSSMPKLKDFCSNIFVGIQTSADDVFIMDLVEERDDCYLMKSQSLEKEIELEKDHLRHIISGVDVKKYCTPSARQYVLFPYDVIDGKSYLVNKKHLETKEPKVWAYLLENKKKLENREKGKFKDNAWYRFGRNQNIDKQHWKKICVPRLVQEIQAIFDEEGSWCLDNVDVGGVILKNEYQGHEHYFVGLLNSKLLTKYLTKISTPFRGGFWSCNRQYLEQLPIFYPNENDANKILVLKKIEEHVKQAIKLKQMNDERSLKDLWFISGKIDELVEYMYSSDEKNQYLLE